MIEKFDYYVSKNLVKRKSVDREEAKSLIEKAAKRLEYLKQQEINENNTTFIFEDIYEAVREAIQALMSLKGYKPYSHEAVVAFVREFYALPEHTISTVNRYRILRNKVVYSATNISVLSCKEALKFAEKFIQKLKTIFEEEYKK